jgi:phosphatidylglycerophosphatase C
MGAGTAAPDAAVGGPRALALFDLDGTLTRHDTLATYVAGFLWRHPERIPRVLCALPALVRYAWRRDRGEVKSALMQAALGGIERAELDAWTTHFVATLIERGLYDDARATLEAHRRRGDSLALLSASPDLYVPAIARALGFAESMCTGVEWRGDRLTGRLVTPNRRGAEKVRCLDTLRRLHPELESVAYGNAESDLEHLVLADRAVLVNGSARARRRAARLGVACCTWR